MPDKEDPTADIYRMMDEVGLNVGHLFDTTKPISQIMNKLRTDLALKLKVYIEEREAKNG